MTRLLDSLTITKYTELYYQRLRRYFERLGRNHLNLKKSINGYLNHFLLPLKMKFNQRKFKKRINRGAILYGLKLILCPGNIFETQLLRRQKLVNCFL